MSLIAVLKVSLNFLENEIFDQIGFQVEPGDRIGLVGPNGSGKTTLLRLLNGELIPDIGEVRVMRGVRTGYLPQDVQETLSGPLLPSLLESVEDRVSLQETLRRLEADLSADRNKNRQEEIAEKITDAHHRIQDLDAEFPAHEAEKILVGLGFFPSDFDKPVSSLSGGWKTRAALASLLYRKPDLLLLDEPTNHLDIPSVRWLEQFLEDFKGAMILVSHDRDFLNRQVQKILSLEMEGLRVYSGNYEAYLKAREEERKILEARARNKEQKVKEAQKFIERFRAKASKARQAQSKIKLLKKMELVETHRKEKPIRFSFPEVARSGRETISIQELSKGFGDKTLYEDLTLTVLRGERIAVIGPNGSGKTTLLKMIAGEIEPDAGSIRLGHGVRMSYFAQHQSEMLNPENTVIQEVYKAVPDQSLSFVRGVCGAFLFSGNDVEKPVRVLSGGEKARVSLARILVQPGNLMVMDEPTNHLDLESSEKLIDALNDYGGTLVFVSHNQSFINRLATKIWDIDKGEVTEYPGNLYEYYDHLSRMEQGVDSGPGGSPEALGDNAREDESDGSPAGRQNRKVLKRERAEKRRKIREELNPLETEVARIEENISKLEHRQKELDKELQDPEIFKDEKRGVPMLNEYSEIRDRLERLLARWEKTQSRLESTRKRLGV